MGKPRRCSSTFFMEERALLDHRRKKVRLLQQQVHQGQVREREREGGREGGEGGREGGEGRGGEWKGWRGGKGGERRRGKGGEAK